jgi:hypothetical protein
MRTRWILTALAAVLWCGPALAAPDDKPAPKRSPEQVFQKRDTNGDGFLTLEEMKGKKTRDAAKLAKRFARLDRDGDKKVSLDELKAAARARKTAATNPGARARKASRPGKAGATNPGARARKASRPGKVGEPRTTNAKTQKANRTGPAATPPAPR